MDDIQKLMIIWELKDRPGKLFELCFGNNENFSVSKEIESGIRCNEEFIKELPKSTKNYELQIEDYESNIRSFKQLRDN